MDWRLTGAVRRLHIPFITFRWSPSGPFGRMRAL